MKRMLFIWTLLLSVFTLQAKTLIVYYSYTNNVHQIVTDLRTQIQADVLRIEPAEEGLDWANVIVPFDRPFAYHPLWQAYGLTGIPNNFLIDASNGQVIARNLRGDDLAGKLAGLLN